MGLMDTDKTLPANRLVFDVRRDLAMVERFRTDLEGLMQEYGLSDAEKRALREVDLPALSAMGMHPYFLPQVSRLFKGAGYNHKVEVGPEETMDVIEDRVSFFRMFKLRGF